MQILFRKNNISACLNFNQSFCYEHYFTHRDSTITIKVLLLIQTNMEKSEANRLVVSTERRNLSTENRYRLIGAMGRQLLLKFYLASKKRPGYFHKL